MAEAVSRELLSSNSDVSVANERGPELVIDGKSIVEENVAMES